MNHENKLRYSQNWYSDFISALRMRWGGTPLTGIWKESSAACTASNEVIAGALTLGDKIEFTSTKVTKTKVDTNCSVVRTFDLIVVDSTHLDFDFQDLTATGSGCGDPSTLNRSDQSNSYTISDNTLRLTNSSNDACTAYVKQ